MASYCWTLVLLLVVVSRGQTAAINKRPITAIQPISCTSKSGETGVCMFAWHCLLFKGTHLTTCFDGIFVGSCCKLPPASTSVPNNEVLPPDPVSPQEPTKRPTSTPSTPAEASLDWRPVTSTSVVTSIPDQGPPDSGETVYIVETTTVLTPNATESSEDALSTAESVTNSSSVSTELTNQPVNEPVTDVGGGHDDSQLQPGTELPVTDASSSTETVEPSVSVTPSTTAMSTETDPTTEMPVTQQPPTPQPIPSPPTTMLPTTVETSSIPVVPEKITPPTNTTGYFEQNYKKICGRPVYGPQGRIVGGRNAGYAEWPWMISLRQWKKNTFHHKCGAALLNELWAVTAAHCVESIPATDILLRMGEYDVSSEKEPESYEERRVQIVASHHKFDPRTYEYDLALLRFYQPVRFRRNILPICIPEGNDDFVGKMATVTGWGRLYEDGPLPDVLQEVQVPVITTTECEAMYKKAGYVEDIPDIFICAGIPEGGKDSCEGDSGGPMVLKDADGRWLLAGVISWGIGCALPNQPGVYTRISKFSNWIESIIVH